MMRNWAQKMGPRLDRYHPKSSLEAVLEKKLNNSISICVFVLEKSDEENKPK